MSRSSSGIPASGALPAAPPVDPEIAEVLDRVRDWPPTRRLELAQGLVGSVSAELTTHGIPLAAISPRSFMDLLGRLAIEGPPPTDEECERIIEEERMRRYLR